MHQVHCSMRYRRGGPLSCIVALILAIFLFHLFAAAEERGIEADIKRPNIRVKTSSDRDVLTYNISFDVRLRNLSKQVLEVSSSPMIMVTAIESRSSDGIWHSLNQISYYDYGQVRYSRCESVPGGSSVSITHVRTGMALLRTQAVKLGSRPVLRFALQIQCRGMDRTVVGTPVFVTQPISVLLPTLAH